MWYNIAMIIINILIGGIAVATGSITSEVTFIASISLILITGIYGIIRAVTDKKGGAPLVTAVVLSCIATSVLTIGTVVSVPILIFCMYGILTNAFSQKEVGHPFVKSLIVAAVAIVVAIRWPEEIYPITIPSVAQYGLLALLCVQVAVAGLSFNNTFSVLSDKLDTARQAANTDKLTGLYNRQSLNVFVKNLATYSGTFAVIMMDIDNFKKVNDTYGHTEGDRILQDLANVIKKCKRDSDRAFRYGGEEFCLICPQTGIAGAKNLAERIRVEFNARKYPYADPPVRFSVSLGVSECRYKEFVSVEDTIKKSDDALYEAKHNGKNRVEISNR